MCRGDLTEKKEIGKNCQLELNLGRMTTTRREGEMEKLKFKEIKGFGLLKMDKFISVTTTKNNHPSSKTTPLLFNNVKDITLQEAIENSRISKKLSKPKLMPTTTTTKITTMPILTETDAREAASAVVIDFKLKRPIQIPHSMSNMAKRAKMDTSKIGHLPKMGDGSLSITLIEKDAQKTMSRPCATVQPTQKPPPTPASTSASPFVPAVKKESEPKQKIIYMYKCDVCSLRYRDNECLLEHKKHHSAADWREYLSSQRHDNENSNGQSHDPDPLDKVGTNFKDPVQKQKVKAQPTKKQSNGNGMACKNGTNGKNRGNGARPLRNLKSPSNSPIKNSPPQPKKGQSPTKRRPSGSTSPKKKKKEGAKDPGDGEQRDHVGMESGNKEMAGGFKLEEIIPEQEWPYFDTSGRLYCVCNDVSYGPMVCCDNDQCPREWFHFPCVGLNPEKEIGEWYCPLCAAARLTAKLTAGLRRGKTKGRGFGGKKRKLKHY